MGSWIWKKLLQLRPVAKKFHHMKFHNGQVVGFWTDIWNPRERLIEVIGKRGTHKLGIARNSQISDVIVDHE